MAAKTKTTSNKLARLSGAVKRRALGRKRTKQPVAKRDLPGQFQFIKEVCVQLWRERSLFLKLFAVAVVGAAVLFGATQQDQYVTTSNAIKEYAETLAGDGFDSTVQFGILLTTAATGGLNTTLSETQRVYFFFFYLLIWMTTIWLLRYRLANAAVKVRDGLYSAGGPVVAALVLFLIAMIQLIPLALGVIVYSAATSSGVLNGPLETGLFAVGTILLGVLSLYWVSGTLFGFIISSNPGTYPIAALKMGNQIVAGHRSKLVFRIVVLAFLLVVVWGIVLVPAVLVDSWLAQSWLPVVVMAIQVLMAFSVMFSATYVYLLYRKMIDEPGN